MGNTCTACQARSEIPTEIITTSANRRVSSRKDDSNVGGRKSSRSNSVLKELTNIVAAQQDQKQSIKDGAQIETDTVVEYAECGIQTTQSLLQKYIASKNEQRRENSLKKIQTTQSKTSEEDDRRTEQSHKKKKFRVQKSVSGEQLKFRRESFIRLQKENINQKYIFQSKLGQGAYGCVFRCIDRVSRCQRAVKIIRKKAVKNNNSWLAQLQILRTMDHPNIVKLFQIYDFNDFFYVVTELCTGGELFDYVRGAKKIVERNVASLMKQILSAVHYMHQKNIVHRDLKPQNIVLEQKASLTVSRKQAPVLKIIDFGTAIEFQPGKFFSEKVGSPYYVAPEVLEHKYNEKCDLWSCGVILYTLLSGSPPFRGHTQKEIFEEIIKAKPLYEQKIWPKISDEAKDLIENLLQRNINKRLSAEQALNHPWINECGSMVPIDQGVLQNLQKFYFRNKFNAIVETYLAVSNISQEDRRNLAQKFKQIDKDNSGFIEQSELYEAFHSIYGDIYDEATIREIISNIDSNGSGKIDFTQFIVALTKKQKLFQKNSLQQAFNFFDKDKTGFIQGNDLKIILGNSTEDEVQRILKTLDEDNDKRISKDEFVKRLMQKDLDE